MSIKFYDLVGELATVALDASNNPVTVSFIEGGLGLTGYKPFLGTASNGDELYVKLEQTAQSAFAVVIATYNVNEFGIRSLVINRVVSKYGTLSPGAYVETTVFNDISINHNVSANQLIVKSQTSSFIPESQTSDYVVSLSGNTTVRLPLADVSTENVKYGFLLANKYSGSDTLTIAASGSNQILVNNNTFSSVSITGVGAYIEFIASSGGQWYRLYSTELLSGESAGSFVGGVNKTLQFNNAGSISGGKAYWDDPTKTLYFGDTNNVLNADVVLSASQNKASGIYPLFVRLNNGNFFALTKNGKVAINTQSLPLYESSPNFHMVGRCAVFEGNCGSAGVALTLFNNPDVVPPVGSVGGSFNMSARNSNRNVINYAQVQSKILNPNKGVSSGQFLVNVDVSGFPYNVASLDLGNLIVGNNQLSKSIDSAVMGKKNALTAVSGGKVLGNNNTIDYINDIYVIGSDNSVDFVKNSARYVLSEANITVLSGLDWTDLEDLQAGDIVHVINNNVLNGYYIAQETNWVKVDDSVAVGYMGNANFIIGSDSVLSGNNLIAIGSNDVASGNNLSVFGNFNNIRTQSISDIIQTNFRPDYSTVVGNVNSFDASGIIVLGNRNAGSGIRALMLNGSLNTIGSGTIDSVVIGNSNEITIVSGISIGNRNFGVQTLSTVIGTDNIVNGINNLVLGSDVQSSGNNNVIVGDTIFATGINNVLNGSNVSSSGSQNLLYGANLGLQGSSGILLGSDISVTGENNIVGGRNNSILGSGNVILSRNTLASGNLTNTTVYGSDNVLDNSNYIYANILGQNNSLASGTLHNLLLGTNNSIQNRYDFTVTPIAFNAADGGTRFTNVEGAPFISNYRVDDDILYLDGDNNVLGSGSLQAVYVPSDDDAALVLQPRVPFAATSAVFIVSSTKQKEDVLRYARPVSVIGNENQIVGFSGVIVGHNNAISGYNNTVIGSDNIYGGDNSIIISQRFAGSGFNNVVNIGFNNIGGLSGSNTLGQNNFAIGFENNVIGLNNSVAGDTDVLGNNNRLFNGDISALGKNNTFIGKGQAVATDLSEIYDAKNRLDFSGSSTNAVGSGYYSAASQCLLLDNDISWQFASGNRVAVQLYYNEIPLPTYIGIVTNNPKIVDGFKAVFFDNYISVGAGAAQVEILVNTTSINQFVENYFPSQIPDTLRCGLQHKTDGSSLVVGSGNLIIGSPYSTVIGNMNQVGADWNEPKEVTAVSGLILGHNNQTYHPLALIKNSAGAIVGAQPLYPDVSGLFQGAIGFDIRNTDPNSIKVGYDQNVFKIFDLGGKKDTRLTRVIDPNVTPPETVSFLGEKIGTGIYQRGLVFNAENLDNSLHILNNNKDKHPVLSVVSQGSGYVGINKDYPLYDLDVSGTINSDNILSTYITTNNLQIQSGAAPGYFLSSLDGDGNAEWVAGVKVDVSGYPGTLVYYSGSPETGGKVQPISLSTIIQNKEWQINTYIYEPSGCNVSRSGLIFDQFMNVDKYAVMTLDEHRRSVTSYPVEEVQKLLEVNPGKIDYVKRLIDLAKEKKFSDESHFIPRQYNTLYFIPESTAYSTPSADDVLAGSNSSMMNHLKFAGQSIQSIFAIGRRKTELSQPTQLDRGEDVDLNNKLFPGGLSAPQIVLSTIPKKDLVGNSYLKPEFKYNYDELVSSYMAPYNQITGSNSSQFDLIRPMTGGAAAPIPGVTAVRSYQSWWFYDPAKNKGSKPLESRYSTVKRTVPTSFNLARGEVDFVIYGTGSKYPQDQVSKFLFGDVEQYATWKKTGLGREDSNFPFLTTIPAFYFNSSNGSFMIHTDKPAWIPTKVAADCEPCDPIQSGINFADLTVRGWIGTSGIRVGQGFRRALTTNNEGNLIEAVDGQGNPVYETTAGMVLMSDAYGFATWTPLGGAVSSNQTLSSQAVTTQNIVLTEGSLDPIGSVTNTGLESLESDSARLFRDTVDVSNETTIANPVLRLRGVTRNSLLFAKNPLPNRNDNFANKFNESSLPTNPNEMNIDGTENLFYYGYTNALAGVVDVNPESQTTEVIIDGDATRRFNVNDIVRVFYKFDTVTQTETIRTSTIERARVVGLYTVSLSTPVNGRTTRTSVILDKMLTNVAEPTYLLDSSNELRNVAIISQSIGGYLTFNFPGTNPDVVISNRQNIDTTFNANGKFTNFGVYGSKNNNTVTPIVYADTISNTLQVKDKTPFIYGYEKRTIDSVSPSLEKDINSLLYYDYNINGSYISATYNENDNTLTTTDSQDVVVGDIIEILYDSVQDTKALVKSIAGNVITVSFRDINLGMIENKIGNIIRSEGGGIVNSNFKFRVIKRQLSKNVNVVNSSVVIKAEDKIPLYADFSVRGLTYTDGLMLGEKDKANNIIVANQSILYSNNGLVSGSNLRYVDIVALNNNNAVSKHLVFNSIMPQALSLAKYRDKPELPTSASNPEKLQPVFANLSMYGSIYAQNMSVDTLNKFNTIDGGVVKFRGSCNGNDNVCIEPEPEPILTTVVLGFVASDASKGQ